MGSVSGCQISTGRMAEEGWSLLWGSAASVGETNNGENIVRGRLEHCFLATHKRGKIPWLSTCNCNNLVRFVRRKWREKDDASNISHA